jgi:hypothetical protein
LAVRADPGVPSLEAQAIASSNLKVLPSRTAVPGASPAPCAGGVEECLIEPFLDRILGLVVAVCVSAATSVAARSSSPSTTATAARTRSLEHGPDDRFAGELEFLAERVRSGVGFTRQKRSQAKIAVVGHS